MIIRGQQLQIVLRSVDISAQYRPVHKCRKDNFGIIYVCSKKPLYTNHLPCVFDIGCFG